MSDCWGPWDSGNSELQGCLGELRGSFLPSPLYLHREVPGELLSPQKLTSVAGPGSALHHGAHSLLPALLLAPGAPHLASPEALTPWLYSLIHSANTGCIPTVYWALGM